MRRAVIAALFLVPLLGVCPVAQQRFSNATAGIALSPPAGWSVVSMQEVMQNRANIRLSDSELQAGLQRATAPLFAFAKYPEPHPTLNPTFQIVLRPSPAPPGTPATTILAAATQTLQKVYPDFQFIEPIRSTVVSGLPAASMKAAYTLRTQQGNAHRIVVRMWLVPRGSTMFLIGGSGPIDGPDVSEGEFESALASIQIEP
ncbi:MAG TPA: hypothetical protein VM846_14395 [Vicinamibacterales bacterium]|jgi:hypothetical protein|nr:hypothetical protein [Vicinamibacterales bacterium]